MRDAQDWLTLALGIIALLSALAGFWVKWLRPKVRRASAEITEVRDNILGRPAIVNEITKKEVAPAVPSLGAQIAGLGEAVRELTKSHARLDNLETRVDKVEGYEVRIIKLEEASIERIVTRAESAAGWTAMAEAIKADPDVTVEPES